MNDKSKLRYLFIFSAIWLVLLTAVPTVFYKALPLDTVEAIAWGNPLEMGNAKHPPLGGWLAGIFDRLFCHTDFAMYFLSQVLTVAGFYYLYKLAREYFDVTKSVLTVVVLSFVMYYSFGSSTYNVNLPQMLFWPMAIYYFVRGYHGGKLRDWLLFGLATGLVTLSKYYGLILPFSLFIFVLTSRESRKLFAKPGPYLAAVVFLLVMLPYIVWLFQYDFLPFQYIAARVSEEDESHWYTFLFVFAVCVALVPIPLAVLWGALDHPLRALRGIRRPEHVHAEAFRLGLCLFLVPSIVFSVLSILGASVDLKWTFPIYITNGIFLLSFWKDDITDREFRKVYAFSLTVLVAFQVWDVVYFLTSTNRRRHFDMRRVAREAHEFYTKATGRDRIPAVYGDLWYSASIGHYLPYHPHAGSEEDDYDAIRFADELREYGGLAAINELEDVEVIRKYFPVDDSNIEEHQVFYHAPWGREKDRTYYFAVIPPATAPATTAPSAD